MVSLTSHPCLFRPDNSHIEHPSEPFISNPIDSTCLFDHPYPPNTSVFVFRVLLRMMPDVRNNLSDTLLL